MSVPLSTAGAESRRGSGVVRRVRLRCLRPRSAMIRLPMLNVDLWFAGVRDGDEWAAQSAAPNALLLHRARKMYSAQRSRFVTYAAIGINLSESGCCRNEALERHSKALHIGRCGGVPRGHERDVSNIRLVPGAVNGDRNLDHRVFADSAERSAASMPAGRAERTVGAQRRLPTFLSSHGDGFLAMRIARFVQRAGFEHRDQDSKQTIGDAAKRAAVPM